MPVKREIDAFSRNEPMFSLRLKPTGSVYWSYQAPRVLLSTRKRTSEEMPPPICTSSFGTARRFRFGFGLSCAAS